MDVYAAKNKILYIHAKWLHDNGYYKEFQDCVHQAATYDSHHDLRQLRARQGIKRIDDRLVGVYTKASR